jgi:ABC-2 type transport system ATP-binding protein
MSQSTSGVMISVQDLTKEYGMVKAVDHISFEVSRGTIVGFLGPNGAGKTTTMRILTTYLPATSGVAKVAGYDVMYESMEVRRNIGYLPESVPLYPEMRVEEYLLYRARLKQVDRRIRKARIDKCMERCRIREVRRRLIGTLSKGYRQRVGLADSLVHDPPILIMDEPTSGLDPLQIRETLNTIKELGQEHTILLSTHILSEVEAVCERVIIINRGKIGLDSPLKQLSTDTTDVQVEVKCPPETARRVLESVPGVASVTVRELPGGWTEADVRTQNDQDLREVIAAKIQQNQWPLRRLDLRQRRLEDHFVEVVVRGDSSSTALPNGYTAAQTPATATYA